MYDIANIAFRRGCTVDFINQFSFLLMRNDRLQIKTESRFDIEIIHQMLAIRPIELYAESTAGDAITVSISAPVGITIAKLTEDDKHANYFADIDNQVYHRLVLPLEGTQPGWFFDTKGVSGIEALVSQPIVIKALMEEGKTHAMLFAASSDVIIAPVTDSKYKRVTYDPSCVPEALLRLVDIVDEELPKRRNSLEMLLNRLNSSIKVLSRFNVKYLTLYAREECDNAIAELEDCVRKVNIAIEECRYQDPFEHLLYQKVMVKLKQVVGAKQFERVLSTLHRSVTDELYRKVDAEAMIDNGSVYEKVLSSIDNLGIADDVLRVLSYRLDKHFDACGCSTCGEQPKIYKTAGSKKFNISCPKCDKSLDENLATGNRIVAISKWNNQNPPDDPTYWLAKLGMQARPGEEPIDSIKQLLTVSMRMASYINKEMPPVIKQSEDTSILKDTIEVLRFLTSQLKNN